MKKTLLIIVIFCLFTFTLFSYGVKKGMMRKIDFDMTVKIQDLIDKSPRLRLSEFTGNVMEGATFFASPEFSIVVVFILTGLAAYDWKKRRLRWVAVIIPLAFLFLTLAEIYGKTVVHHPAPPFFMIKNPTSIFPKYYINEQFSYPSGHAARAIFLAILSFSILNSQFSILNAVRKKKRQYVLISLLVCYVALVSISRIYLGHHWLTDIIGGLFLGSGFGFLSVIKL